MLWRGSIIGWLGGQQVCQIRNLVLWGGSGHWWHRPQRRRSYVQLRSTFGGGRLTLHNIFRIVPFMNFSRWRIRCQYQAGSCSVRTRILTGRRSVALPERERRGVRVARRIIFSLKELYRGSSLTACSKGGDMIHTP